MSDAVILAVISAVVTVVTVVVQGKKTKGDIETSEKKTAAGLSVIRAELARHVAHSTSPRDDMPERRRPPHG